MNIKAIFFKEWIKLRKLFPVGAMLLLGALVLFFVGFGATNRELSAKLMLYRIVVLHMVYYKVLLYFLVGLPVLLAVFQFVPERIQNRYKISMQLPQKESLTIAHMLLFGFSVLTLAWIILFSGFFIISVLYFPVHVVWYASDTLLGWFLCGYMLYFLVSAAMVEPSIKVKVLPALFALALSVVMFGIDNNRAYDTFLFVLPVFVLASALFAHHSFTRLYKGVL